MNKKHTHVPVSQSILCLAAAGCASELVRGTEQAASTPFPCRDSKKSGLAFSTGNCCLFRAGWCLSSRGDCPQAARSLSAQPRAGPGRGDGSAGQHNLFRHWSETNTTFHKDNFIFTFLHVCKRMFFFLGCASRHIIPYRMEFSNFFKIYIYVHTYI